MQVPPHSQMKKVSLRALRETDLDDVFEWASDDLVTATLMWNSYRSKEDVLTYLRHVVSAHLWFKAICLGSKVIGAITLEKGQGAHACSAELGYVINRKYWGKGYTTQAVKEALRTGFTDLNIVRIEAFVHPQNISSQRVLEKSGFKREGMLKLSLIQKGQIQDQYVYASLSPPPRVPR